MHSRRGLHRIAVAALLPVAMYLRLVLLFAFLPLAGYAQTTVSGRVLDAKSGAGLPGVTVLQTSTLIGISSDAEGNFRLVVPMTTDSIALTISSVGYVTQRRRVAAGSNSITLLVTDNRFIDCIFVSPRVEIGLSSEIRYAPFGGTLKLYAQRLLRLPITASVGYHTNFGSNQAVTATLDLPRVLPGRHLTISPSLHYQHLRAEPANLLFSSYTATAGVNVYGIGAEWLPNVLLGGGYAQCIPLTAEATATAAGYGYLLGLSSSQLPFRFEGSAQVTRWPGYWQWQAQLQRYLRGHLLAGVAFNQLRHYTGVSLALSRTFY